MGLVDYDSDTSEPSDQTVQKPSLFAAIPPPKNRQIKDRKKIIVDLPQPDESEAEPEEDNSVKRQSGGGLASLLPAPKRSKLGPKDGTSSSAALNLQSPSSSRTNGESIMNKPDAEVTFTGSALSFKPKTVTKKTDSTTNTKKKVVQSLFSIDTSGSSNRITGQHTDNADTYQPILANESRPISVPVRRQEEQEEEESTVLPSVHPSEQFRYDPDADYSASFTISSQPKQQRHEPSVNKKRQAKDNEFHTAKITQEYNINQVYEANQRIDEAAEAAAAPVRFVGSGKHQLSSLLNLAHSQRDSLEESFTSQRKAMRDAKAKYGR